MDAKKINRGMDMQLEMVTELEELMEKAPDDTDASKLDMLRSYTTNLRTVCEFAKELVEKSKVAEVTEDKPTKKADEDLDFLD